MKHRLLLMLLSVCFLVVMMKTVKADGVLVSSETLRATEKNSGKTYEKELLIDGKWGTGPGEFGLAYYEPIGEPHGPSGVAMNSLGEIYVLDGINSRIQKFDKHGKYLLSIPIISIADETGRSVTDGLITDEDDPPPHLSVLVEPVIIGIDIVIDAEDNLYYYLINHKLLKGEMWLFKNDSFVEKWEVPVGGNISVGQGLVYDDRDDSIWIYNSLVGNEKSFDNKDFRRHFEVKSGRIYSDNEIEKYKNTLEKIAKKRWPFICETTKDRMIIYKKIYKS